MIRIETIVYSLFEFFVDPPDFGRRLAVFGCKPLIFSFFHQTYDQFSGVRLYSPLAKCAGIPDERSHQVHP